MLINEMLFGHHYITLKKYLLLLIRSIEMPFLGDRLSYWTGPIKFKTQLNMITYVCVCTGCAVWLCACVWTAPVCWLNIDLWSVTHGSNPLFLLLMAVCAEVVCPGPSVPCLHAKHNRTLQLPVLTLTFLLLLQPHLQKETKHREAPHK